MTRHSVQKPTRLTKLTSYLTKNRLLTPACMTIVVGIFVGIHTGDVLV